VSWLVGKGGSALKDLSTRLETLRENLAKRGK
jgi:oleate hydratase